MVSARMSARGLCLALLLVACGGGPADGPPARQVRTPAPEAQDEPVVEMDSAAVANAIEDADAADADAERTYIERKASMDTRENCLRQAAGLDPELQKTIREACGRLRSEKDPPPR